MNIEDLKAEAQKTLDNAKGIVDEAPGLFQKYKVAIIVGAACVVGTIVIVAMFIGRPTLF